MAQSLEDIDSVLSWTEPVNESTPVSTLRRWRTELVRASVFASYAIGVLSLDVEILNHSPAPMGEDVLQSLVDDLPNILASGWVGGGWSLSPDASTSVAAAAELEMDQSGSLLSLHAELIESDLGDPDVVRNLLVRVKQHRQELTERRDLLEDRIRRIQAIIRHHYATGVASIDDWLT